MMENNLNYTMSTGSAWLPFLAIEQLWQSLDAAQQRFFNKFSHAVKELDEVVFPAPLSKQPDKTMPFDPLQHATEEPAAIRFAARNALREENSILLPGNTTTILEKLASADTATATTHLTIDRKMEMGERGEIDEKGEIQFSPIFSNLSQSSTFHPSTLHLSPFTLSPFPEQSVIEPAPIQAEESLVTRHSSLVTQHEGGGTVNNYNVSFEHLIGTVNNSFETVQDATQESNGFMQQLTDALKTILNDTNYTK